MHRDNVFSAAVLRLSRGLQPLDMNNINDASKISGLTRVATDVSSLYSLQVSKTDW